MRLAQRIAMESDFIQADCVEAMEFPDLAGRYRVHAVPKTMINRSASIEGAVPEEFFLEELLKVLPPRPAGEPSPPAGA